VVAILALYRPWFTNRVDNAIYDYTLRWSGTKPSSGRVAIVDVDERSLARYGQWPWRRDTIARLVSGIRDAGASVVALDIIFAEPDRGSEQADEGFAETLRGGRVVLGYGLTFDGPADEGPPCILHPLSVAIVQRSGDTEASPFFRATGTVCSLPSLANAAGASGFLNAAPDRDGILRRVPLLVEFKGRVYPSLALAAVTAADDMRDAVVHALHSNATVLALDHRRVPLDGKGNLLVRFRGRKRTFPYVSAADVLDGRIPVDALRNKVVVVGTSALGTREVVATPLDTLFVGVEVQATVADNLLVGDFLRRPEYQSGIESAATLAAAGLVIGGAARGLIAGVALGAGGLAVLWAMSVWLLAQGVFVSPVFPTLGWLAAFTAVGIARYGLERKRADDAGLETTAARTLMIQALLSLTEVRDAETGQHSRRTQRYTKLLADELSNHPRFQRYLTPERIELLSTLAPLHDIGKVGVPDSILNKPGPLTPEELLEMRRHTVYGRDVIVNAERKAVVRDDAILSLAKEIVYTHHERWDGAGYPEGLRGEAIPVAGRILAVVDVYDAATTRTLYRSTLSHADAIAFIRSHRGTQFDPAVVDALDRVSDEFLSPHPLRHV
jgi:adenylate cyclase